MTIPALTKPVDELTAQDIRGLVTNQIQEGELVEFKEGLSSSGGSGQVGGPIRITNDVKAKILKEIVAFANGYGGRLFIGIEEDRENPPVARAVAPLADCADLADRLGRICGDLIDPPMLRLDVEGIVTDQDGSGVVDIDVPRSIRAPHMSERDHRSYRRRGTESVPMDMRDIQDMTLRSASRFSEIEAEFAKRTKDFEDYAGSFESVHGSGYCLRLSFVPLDDVSLGRVYQNPAVAPEMVDLSAVFEDQLENRSQIQFPRQYFEERPIVRGTSLRNSPYSFGQGLHELKIDLWSNGGLDIWFGHNDHINGNLRLYADWLVALLANGLRNIERIKRFATSPSLSYGLEAQMKVFGENAVLYSFGEYEIFMDNGVFSIGDHVLPRSEVSSINDFDDLVNRFLMDWFNDAGRDWVKRISVNFRVDGIRS